jgi:anti-anti-sigma factor
MKVKHFILEPEVHVIKVGGAMTAAGTDELKQIFRELSTEQTRLIVVDMEDVPFIDSSGLTLLTMGLRTLNCGAENFRLAGLSSQPKLVFELTGFDRVFHTYNSVAEALGQPSPVMA